MRKRNIAALGGLVFAAYWLGTLDRCSERATEPQRAIIEDVVCSRGVKALESNVYQKGMKEPVYHMEIAN